MLAFSPSALTRSTGHGSPLQDCNPSVRSRSSSGHDLKQIEAAAGGADLFLLPSQRGSCRRSKEQADK